MFPLNKTHLTLLVCGASVVAGATYLHAQDNYPAPAATPEAATQDFYKLLDSFALLARNNPIYESASWSAIMGDSATNALDYAGNYADPTVLSSTSEYAGLGSISRAQVQAIEKNAPRDTPLQLMLTLAYQKEQPQYATNVAAKNGDQTVVEIAPGAPAKREVVTVAEDGGYRVDLKETYGRWNDLSGDKLDLKWYQITKIASPSLLNNPIFVRMRENERRSSCQSNMKQQALGMLQYAQDYDEKLPPARNWIDVLQPYVKSEQIFVCPSLQAAGIKGNGYAFNQYLSQKSQGRLQDISSTVAIYETSNPARNWFGPGTGRAYRHEGGSNLAFADGHVKWFLKGQEKGVKFKPIFD